LLALPAVSPVGDSDDLYNSILGATAVFRHFTVDDTWRGWDGSSCRQYAGPFANLGSSVAVGDVPCFDVLPGEGYGVIGSHSQFQIQGTDAPTTINLLGPASGVSLQGLNLISLPFCPLDSASAPIVDAENLIDDVGPNAVNVQRYLCASDSFEVYNGVVGTAFPITAGEGYFVQVSTDTSYATHVGGACGLPTFCTQFPGVTYNVGGIANTSSFSFTVKKADGTYVCHDNCASLTIGDGANTIAQKFAAAINAKCDPAASAFAAGTQFSVFFNVPGAHHLWVGTGLSAGCDPEDPCDAGCDVQASGTCSFNPTISVVANGSVPTLSVWGMIALIALLLAACTVELLRRRHA
jgi:hypothetical protein